LTLSITCRAFSPIAHDDDAAHHFTLTVVVGDAPPQLRADFHRGHVAQKDGNPPVIHLQRHGIKVVDALDIPQPPDHEFGLAHFHQAAAHIRVAALDGHADFLDGDVVGPQLVGVHDHLVLLDISADGGHLGHPRHAGQFVAQKPVLDGAQLRQVVAVALQGVFVDPADTGGIRTQGGVTPLGQAAGNEIQVFQHTAAGPVKVGAVFENDVDERNAEKGIPRTTLANGTDSMAWSTGR
jgi:hypothetical protein